MIYKYLYWKIEVFRDIFSARFILIFILVYFNGKKPYFEEIDGCINCEYYQDFKNIKMIDGNYIEIDVNREGQERPLHEALIACLIFGCADKGKSMLNPYMGTKEGIEYWRKHKDLANKQGLENMVKFLEERNHQIPADLRLALKRASSSD